MAFKATIFKAVFQVSDIDQGHYGDYSLTLARHPSETDERMMIRLLAFALNAKDEPEFTKGLSTIDEPDLWRKDLTDAIDLWIEVGQPDIKRLRKAGGRAQRVRIYCYNQRSTDIWWNQNAEALNALDNLEVTELVVRSPDTLANLVERNMKLSCTIQDKTIWLASSSLNVEIELRVLKQTAAR